MYHLPAYVALLRWAAGRTVVVVGPVEPEGLRVLASARPERLILVDAEGRGGPPADAQIPVDRIARLADANLGAASVGVIACIEAYPWLDRSQRKALLVDARRLLRPDGVVATWLPVGDDVGLDFWDFEDELSATFEHVHLFAQLPWHGVSLAPVVDEGGPAVALELDESLLRDAPATTHYLALCMPTAPARSELETLAGTCLMIPVPAQSADARSLEELEAEVQRRATDIAVLTRTVRDLEDSMAGLHEREESLLRELHEQTERADEQESRYTEVAAEREHLSRQLELTIADREGARHLAARVEAELGLVRRRLDEQEARLTEKTESVSRLEQELAVLRTRLEHQQAQLVESKSREQELSQSAAQGVERTRALSEVAQDRDRLREEIARRSTELRAVEERLWATHEQLQQERIENVRSSAEVERLREQLDRHQLVEERHVKEIERLSAELHGLEVERAKLSAMLQVREGEVERLGRQLELRGEEPDEVAALRRELSVRDKELADVRVLLEQLKVRETEARTQVTERTRQLGDVRTELEQLRHSLRERESAAAVLQADLDVREVEVEQSAAALEDLKAQVAQQRERAERAEARQAELQQDVERQATEQESLRRRLETREEEFEALVTAQDASAVELYKLRHELSQGAAPTADGESDERPAARETATAIPAISTAAASAVPEPGVEAPAGTDPRLARIRRLELEIEVRAQEQEFLLSKLDEAEQKIWEMSDSADRNAARLAASLAQLEDHKEQLSETQDELEVTRKLLAAAQARALEQERLLASERAKLARVGGQGGLATAVVAPNADGSALEDVDQLFAELELGDQKMVSLGQPTPKPRPPKTDDAIPHAVEVTGSNESTGARVLIETLPEADWPDDA